ncbi:hypothetical protein DACRYDRAFT_13281 [Dacryopinax primogenitus]|uniref:N-acetyltransferase domain-containing protein n=1 Tax=Dacryopinax primogenitus (strain DJM 731) TaxID=1858805 RepID=M5G8X5_DACPD|nr:uncharacterized protein DACRYDRAFT_13281 [Dacryopinax primogenitus]EJU05174.1 hypothetical protein DACRYDRAFT_13281 [Dacryopinax primogenitus]
MLPSKFKIRQLVDATPAERSTLTQVVMEAYAQDPHVSAISGGQLSNLPLYEKLTSCFVNAGCVEGLVWIAELEGKMVGASIWWPPGVEFMSSEKQREVAKWDEYLVMLEPGLAEWIMSSFIPEGGAFCAQSFGGATVLNDAWGLQILCVVPSHQRQGIGRALFEIGARKALASGERLVWETANPNGPAMYKSWGAEIRGEEEFESKYEDKKYMFWCMELPRPPIASL